MPAITRSGLPVPMRPALRVQSRFTMRAILAGVALGPARSAAIDQSDSPGRTDALRLASRVAPTSGRSSGAVVLPAARGASDLVAGVPGLVPAAPLPAARSRRWRGRRSARWPCGLPAPAASGSASSGHRVRWRASGLVLRGRRQGGGSRHRRFRWLRRSRWLIRAGSEHRAPLRAPALGVVGRRRPRTSGTGTLSSSGTRVSSPGSGSRRGWVEAALCPPPAHRLPGRSRARGAPGRGHRHERSGE